MYLQGRTGQTGVTRARDEAELLELAHCAGVEISPQMFAVVLELLRLDVTPQGIVAFLRTIKNAKLQQAIASPH
ncbi:hypothetical protein AB1Y20_014513 [Prymnesium parvum]|uniref:Mitotic-spindle organizing protein 1 n=1 Tax=Prymnesium parvum TaxID=97485 RepID=A0AB34IDA2_PRYPA